MIRVEKLRISAASLGEKNPLPDIKNNTYIHAPIKVTDNIKAGELPDIGKGMIPTMLPYLTEDGYNREKRESKFDIVVLENEFLRAEFLPALGGRLRRLYDKEAKRELLYVNPVFQPCNLALRNAWFSGGVEFNVGIKGHNPLTCSPVFAERRALADGNEYVSFYEYERIRGVVWSVNAYLPEGARALTLRCCIENKSAKETPMYWWSNIAVEESRGVRVIVPAHKTYVNYFGNDSYVLDKADMPNCLDTDVSYPENLPRSLDFFYDIPKERNKWIAALDREGYGLLHFSDRRLLGRKLFVWGNSHGGRHWAEYLSEKDSCYIEIQAGLAHTQLEHFKMDADSRIEWVEHYAPLSCESKDIHGEWDMAVDTVENKISEIAAPEMPHLCAASALKEREMLFRGSGWGALEEKVRGEKISDFFYDWQSNDTETHDFEALLAEGKLERREPLCAPCGYVTGEFWRKKLWSASEKYGDWYSYLQLGTTLYELFCKGDADAEISCVEAWECSIEAENNPWALRNLGAYFAAEKRDYRKAVEYSLAALMLKPDERSLAVDCAQILFAAERCRESGESVISLPDENGYRTWLDAYKKLDTSVAAVGRIRLMSAAAMLKLGMIEEAEQIINESFQMPDIKEGEVSVSALWFELQAAKHGVALDVAKERFELPYALDFRMH